MEPPTLRVTQDVALLAECDHFLIYLHGQTWTRGAATEAFAAEVVASMDAGINTLLAHEMIGVGGQEARFGCEFGDFFRSPPDGTPAELLQRGIYAKIAVALKGAEWRKVSMVMLAQAVEAGKDNDSSTDAGEQGAKREGTRQKARHVGNMRRQLSMGRGLLSMSQIKVVADGDDGDHGAQRPFVMRRMGTAVARNLKQMGMAGTKNISVVVQPTAVELAANSEVSPGVSTDTSCRPASGAGQAAEPTSGELGLRSEIPSVEQVSAENDVVPRAQSLLTSSASTGSCASDIADVRGVQVEVSRHVSRLNARLDNEMSDGSESEAI